MHSNRYDTYEDKVLQQQLYTRKTRIKPILVRFKLSIITKENLA